MIYKALTSGRSKPFAATTAHAATRAESRSGRSIRSPIPLDDEDTKCANVFEEGAFNAFTHNDDDDDDEEDIPLARLRNARAKYDDGDDDEDVPLPKREDKSVKRSSNHELKQEAFPEDSDSGSDDKDDFDKSTEYSAKHSKTAYRHVYNLRCTLSDNNLLLLSGQEPEGISGAASKWSSEDLQGELIESLRNAIRNYQVEFSRLMKNRQIKADLQEFCRKYEGKKDTKEGQWRVRWSSKYMKALNKKINDVKKQIGHGNLRQGAAGTANGSSSSSATTNMLPATGPQKRSGTNPTTGSSSSAVANMPRTTGPQKRSVPNLTIGPSSSATASMSATMAPVQRSRPNLTIGPSSSAAANMSPTMAPLQRSKPNLTIGSSSSAAPGMHPTAAPLKRAVPDPTTATANKQGPTMGAHPSAVRPQQPQAKITFKFSLEKGRKISRHSKHMAFYPEQTWSDVVQKMKEFFPGQDIRRLCFRPHAAFGRPKLRLVKMGDLGDEDWFLVRRDLIRQLEDPHTLSVDVGCQVSS